MIDSAPLFLSVPPDRACAAVADALSEQGFAVREDGHILEVEREAHPVEATAVASRVSFSVRVVAWAGGSAVFFGAGGGPIVISAARLTRTRLSERGLIAGAMGRMADAEPAVATAESGVGGGADGDPASERAAPSDVAVIGGAAVQHADALDESSANEVSDAVGALPATLMPPAGREGHEPPIALTGSPDETSEVGVVAPPDDAYVRDADPPVNPLAIVALVLGFVAPVGGIVAGAVALNLVRRTRERGRGLAIAGILIGSVATVLLSVALAAGASWLIGDAPSSPSAVTSASPTFSAPGDPVASDPPVPTFEPEIGQCFAQRGRGEIGDTSVVDCATPHTYEFYARFPAAAEADAYPGDEELARRAEAGCVEAFASFVGSAYDRSALDYVYLSPTRKTWAVGDRRVSCFVTDPAGSVTGTLRDAVR